MSLGWFSSVIHTEPSSAMTVLPAPSTTLRVWFGPSRTAPDFSSRRIWLSLRLICAACMLAYQTQGERSEEHTSELQSLAYLVCRLLLEKKKNKKYKILLSMRLITAGAA